MTTQSASSLWLARPTPKPQARLRLFCFPFAGGGVAVFRGWAQALPPDVEACYVQLPGRDSRLREPLHNRLLSLVDVLAEAMLPYLDKPFAFFGHSLGALLSFELARVLRKRRGLNPAHLFVSARRAPQLPDPLPPIHPLPEAEFIAALRQRYDGLSLAFLQEPELVQIFLPVLRADLAMVETYNCQPDDPLACPISAFGGLKDGTVKQEALAAWRAQTQNVFAMEMFPGNHFFLQNDQALLLKSLSRQLEQTLTHLT
ncbi:MAG: thioesterase [Chloroflexi bacterium]|nr:thioesterase [Chloroflexota bacterium]